MTAIAGVIEFKTGLRVRADKIVGWEQCEHQDWRVIYIDGHLKLFVQESLEELDIAIGGALV